MSGIVMCFIGAAACLFINFFATGNRGSAQSTLSAIAFIAMLSVLAIGAFVTYVNGWKWLPIYVIYIFIIGPLVNVAVKKVRKY